MKDSLLRVKSFAFALRTIKLQHYLIEQREHTLSKQVLRSGTSIGANIEESVHAQSKPDFINKLSIAQKEASETNYWLRLLRESCLLNPRLADSLIRDCEELQRMLAASIKTSKQSLKKGRNYTVDGT